MDPYQTAPTGAVWSGSTLFVEDASKTIQQTTTTDDFLIKIQSKLGHYGPPAKRNTNGVSLTGP